MGAGPGLNSAPAELLPSLALGIRRFKIKESALPQELGVVEQLAAANGHQRT
jgi:hypothetical protein